MGRLLIALLLIAAFCLGAAVSYYNRADVTFYYLAGQVELPLIALNTGLLLVSSITYGMAMLDMHDGKLRGVQFWLAVTFLFGASFVGVELYEFGSLIAEGADVLHGRHDGVGQRAAHILPSARRQCVVG